MYRLLSLVLACFVTGCSSKQIASMTLSKVNSLKLLAALCLLFHFLTSQAAAQGAYTNGHAGQLKASDVKKLKGLKAPIAVPTYVPAGYRLKEVRSEKQEDGRSWSIDYDLVYENARGNTFVINSANEGIGDALIITVLKGENPFFAGPIGVGPPDPTDGPPGRNIGSDWIDSKRGYAPRGSPSRKQHYRLNAEGLAKREALKIMLSLRYLK